MKLNRAQEEYLIDVGLKVILSELMVPKAPTGVELETLVKAVQPRRQWSADQHQRFTATMKKKRAAEKRNG